MQWTPNIQNNLERRTELKMHTSQFHTYYKVRNQDSIELEKDINQWNRTEDSKINLYINSQLIFFFFFYQLEDNYFTILYWVLSYTEMNQPWIYMCSPSRSLLPPPSPQLIFNKDVMAVQWGNKILFNKWFRDTWLSIYKYT